MTETTSTDAAPKAAAMFDAPRDTPASEAKGYAVYDRTLGQFVSEVTSERPSAKDAKGSVRPGHVHAVVRV